MSVSTDPAQQQPAQAHTAELTLVEGTEIDRFRSIARLPRKVMTGLGVRPGDIVALGNPRYGQCLHARAMVEQSANRENTVALDADQMRSLGSDWGTRIGLAKVDLPVAQSVEFRFTGTLPAQMRAALRTRLAHRLLDRPVSTSETLTIDLTRARHVTVQVVTVDPGPAARVVSNTRLEISGPPMETADAPGLAGVGGLETEIARVREMVELPLQRPDLFEHLGMTAPRGVLFSGPPGSGKTLLARSIADQTDAAFFQINGPEILSKHYGDSEQKLRDIFAAASKRAPSIIFIDEIDAIAPKRSSLSGEKQVERRIVAQLLTLLDGLSDRGQVVVMAATNMPHAIDPALRRPGRFDRELSFPAPDKAARSAILDVHFRNSPLSAEVDLAQIAAATHGYVGADIAALAREAGLAALSRVAMGDNAERNIAVADVEVTNADIDRALALTSPSTLRETAIESPELRWADIGGLDDAKQALTEAVIWPMIHETAYRTMGVRPATGVLLSGPPGGGKTMLARALAFESGANLIPVRAAHLLSPMLGDAERAVAEVFSKARHAAPAIIFIDEVDAIAPVRGASHDALNRVVAQLLVEVDGLEDNRGVFLLAATNRPDAVDPALRRPGRFDLIINIDPPDHASRTEILSLHLASVPTKGIDVRDISVKTKGWSGAELAELTHAAARRALRRWVVDGAGDNLAEVTAADLKAELDAAVRRRLPTDLCGKEI